MLSDETASDEVKIAAGYYSRPRSVERRRGHGARLAHGLSPQSSPDELPSQPQTWRECKQGIHGCQVRGSKVKGLIARKIHFRGLEDMPIGDVRISNQPLSYPLHIRGLQSRLLLAPSRTHHRDSFSFSCLVQVIRKHAHAHAILILHQPCIMYVRDNLS